LIAACGAGHTLFTLILTFLSAAPEHEMQSSGISKKSPSDESANSEIVSMLKN